MKKIIVYTVLLILSAPIFFTSCTTESEKKKDAEISGEEKDNENKTSLHNEPSNIVELSEQKFINSGVVFGTIEKRNLKDIIKCNGALRLPPQNKANVSSLLAGTIKNVNVIEGDYVKRGKILATLLSTQSIQMQEEYIKAKDNLVFLEHEYLRQKELMNNNVTSGKKFQQSESQYKSERGRVNSLRDQLSAIGLSPLKIGKGFTTSLIPVIAPIEGYVSRIDVNIGSYVEAAKEMFEIVDLHHIHIELQVFENDYAKVKVGQKVFFSLPNISDKPIEAVVLATGKAFEAGTRATTIHAEIKNNTNTSLIPGMYINAVIEVGSHKVASVPTEAIVSSGGKQYIFIFKEKKKEGEEQVHLFEMKEVKTGVEEEGYTEIIPLDEIPADSKVAVKGAYFISGEIRKGEGGEEHGH